MTKKLTSSLSRTEKVRRNRAEDRVRRKPSAAGHWQLHEAKTRFAELVRRAKTQGPQHVTVYGREEVVVVSADEFHRMQGEVTGQALIEVMRTSPLRDIAIEPQRTPMPVRDVVL